ncbi:hypothetical protein RA307_14050 [Xanthobacteraceae bacterium Astr-EGSB]|uniref:hypothetical protein n=1 Tax=Astrobacterium formosum TaxID=3069710 RepID=UPI0027AF9460|nr:hypothetical protein [Xanthobacteraceae bacterium Astr-EGSB]
MRTLWGMLATIGLTIAVAGCNSLDGIYVREGVGTTLETADLPEVSYLQDVYVGEICRQAGLRIVTRDGVVLCEEVSMRPAEWATFVQAGMNDIDRRCDAYLAWIDNKRRWREPVLKQISTTAAATAAILGLTGVGATPIAIVGTAFGFAADSFVNIQSRLITEIEHSVVQSVVLGHQNEFRLKLARVPVDNRPAAIYLLRNYLRICMPFSIEMSISNTVTTYNRGGADALRSEPMLTRAPTVARVTSAVPVTPRERIRPQERVSLPSREDYELIISGFDPKVHTIARVEPALVKLCVPEAELRAIGERAKLSVRVFQLASNRELTGKLTTPDLASLNNLRDCPAGRRNYFEANLMEGGLAAPRVITTFNRSLAPDRKLRENATEFEVRSRIPELRSALASKLRLQSPLLSDQMTPDLWGELQRSGL